MGITNIGQYAYRGSQYMRQVFHLLHSGNACLKKRQFVVWLDLPGRERDAQLRVITFWTSYDVIIVLQQLVEPLLYDRFPIATGNADNGK